VARWRLLEWQGRRRCKVEGWFKRGRSLFEGGWIGGGVLQERRGRHKLVREGGYGPCS